MFIIHIVTILALVAIIGVLVWFIMEDRNINCNSNGCTNNCDQGRNCDCDTTTWPFPTAKKP